MARSQFVIALLGLVLLVGCTKAPPAAENKLVSYADGIAKLQELQAEINTAFVQETPKDCDGALHEAADLLSVMGDVAAADGMSAENVDSVKAKSKELFDQLMTIHHGFHDGSSDDTEAFTKVYETVSDGIEQSVKALADIK